MSFEHISAPLTRAIETCARNYAKGHPMFDKNQLPDITEREAAFELCKAWEEANERLYQMEVGDADPEAIRLASAKSKEAQDAYDASGVDLEISPDLGAVRCSVSGTPVRVTDETLDDWVTGELVLRAAIGLPPRPKEGDGQDRCDQTIDMFEAAQ